MEFNIIRLDGEEKEIMLKRIRNGNALWAVIAVLLYASINFAIVPYITEKIGAEAYGFVSLANTFITYIDVISIALNAFASRFVAIEYHKNNIFRANEYYTSVFISNVIICIFLILISIFGIPNLHHMISIPSYLSFEVKILFMLTLFRYCMVLLRTVFEINAFIDNRLDIIEKNRVFSYIIQSFVLIITCNLFKATVWFVGLATSISAFAMLLIQYYYSKILSKELEIKLKYFNFKCVIEILTAGIWNSINNLGNILNSGLDLLIANNMLSSFSMGMVSISKTLGALCYSVVTAISGSFRPKQLQAYSSNKIDELVKQLKNAMRITGLICSIIIAGFYCCGEDFLRLWLPSQDTSVLFKLTMIVLLSDVMIGVVNPLYYVFTLTKKLKLPCIITIIMGLTNVLSMYILIKFTSFGMYAVVLTTMIINFIHFFDTPIYSAYCLNISISTFYPTILKHLFSCPIIIILLSFINHFLPIVNTWGGLIFKIIFIGILDVLIGVILIYSKKIINYITR